jgi:hypothetical protein
MTARTGLVAARANRAGHLEARPRRRSGRHGAVLAAFLQSDVQGDAAAAGELLDAIAGVRRGEPPQPEAIGNAFAVRITADGAALRNVISADSRPEHYSLDEFGAALDAWIAAIERARSRAP